MATDVSRDHVLALKSLSVDAERNAVLAAREGDEEAFRDLYEAYRDPVWTLVLSLVGDPLQSQDILQNVFLKAFRGLSGFRFRSGLYTWIYRIALNECRNHLRRRRAPVLSLDAVIGRREEIDGAPDADRLEARRTALREAVMKLPVRMREVVVLKYVEGLSYREMSRVLRCPPGTVASRLNRALAELEARLRPRGGNS
jgi:RNA polymerase sigma-70 factor (ECF subfamily)